MNNLKNDVISDRKKNSKQKSGICALCLKEKELCQSHLISKGFYNSLIDKNKTLKVAEGKAMISGGTGQLTAKLLCQQCENHFSRWEKIVIGDSYQHQNQKFPLLDKALNAKSKYEITVYPDSFMIFTNEVPEIDWKTYILFSLSIFWRCSAVVNCGDQKTYCNKALGPYQEIIRNLLLMDNSSLPNQMFLAVSLHNDSLNPLNIIAQPTVKRYHGYHVHEFFVPNMRICLFVGKKLPEEFVQLQKENDSFPILVTNLAHSKYGVQISSRFTNAVQTFKLREYLKSEGYS